MYKSNDGINWESINKSVSEIYCYKGTIFGTGGYYTIMSLDNGLTWNYWPYEELAITDMFYSNDICFFVAENPDIISLIYTLDGINFNKINNLNLVNMYYANGMWVGSSYTQKSTYYSENSDIGKILMINDSGNAVWAEPPQSGSAVQILTWEATD